MTVTFIILVAVSFFLFPYLSGDTYDQIVENHEKELQGIVDSTATGLDSLATDSSRVDTSGVQPINDLADVTKNELAILKIEKVKLQAKLDSLASANYQLRSELREKSKRLDEFESQTDPEEFSARVKSLLNLEIGELSPILGKMTNKQIVKMYMSGGNVQREKILRSLNPDKAAEIISEVML